jgi:ADP-ribose pyrophosphatase YjhB (NUDIX family)
MDTPGKTIVIVSGALFSPEGKLLLLRRSSDSQWEMPGGAIEFGEAPEPGLVRCFAEATDIDISTDRPLGSWATVEQSGETARHIVHIDYTVKCSGALLGVQIDREKHAEFAWLAKAEALAKITVPAERHSVDRAFNMLARTRKNG